MDSKRPNPQNPRKGEKVKGWNEKEQKWENNFWSAYYRDKEKILEYQRSRSDLRRYTNHRLLLDWYEILVDNAYEISFDSLIPYESPIIWFLKKQKWLWIMEYIDGKYVYLFDPLFMTKEKEKEFRSKLKELVETRAKKNISKYEDNKHSK